MFVGLAKQSVGRYDLGGTCHTQRRLNTVFLDTGTLCSSVGDITILSSRDICHRMLAKGIPPHISR